jgi:hypothetical protein
MDRKVEELERKMKRTIDEKVQYVDLLKQVLTDESKARQLQFQRKMEELYVDSRIVVCFCFFPVLYIFLISRADGRYVDDFQQRTNNSFQSNNNSDTQSVRSHESTLLVSTSVQESISASKFSLQSNFSSSVRTNDPNPKAADPTPALLATTTSKSLPLSASFRESNRDEKETNAVPTPVAETTTPQPAKKVTPAKPKSHVLLGGRKSVVVDEGKRAAALPIVPEKPPQSKFNKPFHNKFDSFNLKKPIEPTPPFATNANLPPPVNPVPPLADAPSHVREQLQPQPHPIQAPVSSTINAMRDPRRPALNIPNPNPAPAPNDRNNTLASSPINAPNPMPQLNPSEDRNALLNTLGNSSFNPNNNRFNNPQLQPAQQQLSSQAQALQNFVQQSQQISSSFSSQNQPQQQSPHQQNYQQQPMNQNNPHQLNQPNYHQQNRHQDYRSPNSNDSYQQPLQNQGMNRQHPRFQQVCCKCFYFCKNFFLSLCWFILLF